jgi:hypothetical protein
MERLERHRVPLRILCVLCGTYFVARCARGCLTVSLSRCEKKWRVALRSTRPTGEID